MFMKKNRGVTLLALTITIIVMLIISSTVIYTTKSQVSIQKKDKFFADLDKLNSKISDYYQKYGELPVFDTPYCNKTELETLLNTNAQNKNATLVSFEEKVLPDEYTQLEYIESTGTQYIDTGVIANDVSNIKIKFSISGEINSHQGIIGGGWSSDNKTFQIIKNQSTKKISTKYGTTLLEIDSDTSPHTVELSKDGITIDNSQEVNTSEINDNRSICLFVRRSDNNADGIQEYSHCKIFYCEIYSDRNIIKKMVPCKCNTTVKNANNEDCEPGTIGLYDTVERKFYTNKATSGNDFTPGDLINNSPHLNISDDNNYYVIDLEKLEGLTLNYGYNDDYNSIKNSPENISTDSDNIYIINKQSHQIYFPNGIFLNGKMYYTSNNDSNKLIYNTTKAIENTNKINFEDNDIFAVKDLKIYVKGASFEGDINHLPDEYIQLEYIESTGTQYIDTKIISDTIDYKFFFDVTFLCKHSEHAKVLVGDGTPTDLNNFIISGSGVGYYQLFYKGDIYNPNYRLILNSKTHNEVIITQGLQEWIVNNNTVISSNKNDRLEQKNPILIFKGNAGTSDYADPMKAQLYNMKIYSYSNQKLLADYIPCKCTTTVKNVEDKDCLPGTVGLYDTVEGKFYTNKATNGVDFTPGDIIELTDEDKANAGKYKIPITITYNDEGEPENKVTKNIYVSEPLRKLNNSVDYIDFSKSKVIRYVGKDNNNQLVELEEPIEENITIPEINWNGAKSFSVDTDIIPSKIEVTYSTIN